MSTNAQYNAFSLSLSSIGERLPCGSPSKLWTHVIYGGRDIRRRQSSNARHVFEKPAIEFNLRPSLSTYPTQQLPQTMERFLHLRQPQRSISGAVHHQANVKRRTHGVKSLALNKDPIDSFERALGGDEFDDRTPIGPIRVIKIESAEVVEPRKIGSHPSRTSQIIRSLTRHLNGVRKPKVIPFSKRDEVVNGQIVSQPDVKVAKVESTRASREMSDDGVSSSEIANGILANILSENSFAKNASDLLKVLTEPEQTTIGIDQANLQNSTDTADTDIEVAVETTNNGTDSSFVNFNKVDEKINEIGSEIDDYSVDEEWEDFADAKDGTAVSARSRQPGQNSRRRTSQKTTPTPETITKATITSTDVTSSATNALQSKESLSDLLDILGEDGNERKDEESTTIADAVPSSTTISSGNSAEKSKSSDSSEESSEKQKTTVTKATSVTIATTTSRFDDDFRTAVKEERAEVIRIRMREKDAKKSAISKKKTSKKKESKSKDAVDPNTDITPSIEKEKRINTRPKKMSQEEEKLDVEGEETKRRGKKTENSVDEDGDEDAEEHSRENNKNKDEDSAKEENDDDDSEPNTKAKKKGKKMEEKQMRTVEQADVDAESTTEAPEDDEEETTDAEIKHGSKKSRKGKIMKEGKESASDEENEGEDDKGKNEEDDEDDGDEEKDDTMEATSQTPENDDQTAEEIKKNGKKRKEKKMRVKIGEEEGEEDKQEEKKDGEEEGNDDTTTTDQPTKGGGESTNIRTDMIMASLKDAPNAKYYYPPKITVPLPSCFYNPSGYVCCNLQLNNLIEDTFQEIKNIQEYSGCNIAKMANTIQKKSEEMFGHPFESIVALSDFAQNVHFAGDLVCKVEIDGKYMLTYATPYDADHAVEPVAAPEHASEHEDDKKGKDGKKRRKKLNHTKKKPLPIHNFRM
ncbi:hypothetical protein RB195_015470 [Necator americanus]|uniref:Ground-like domain-containing protein n=1 Tax=Necator americanus TaxID=51031 RepID=A0ABR1E4P9_NECAM